MNHFCSLSIRIMLAYVVGFSAETTVFAQGNHHRIHTKHNPGNSGEQGNILYVDPFIGTTKSAVLTRWGGNGGTYPGAVAPSGSIQLSPETRVTGAKGYDYTDHQIYFFSCIKHYSGFPEGSSGHLFVMPVRAGQEFSARISNRAFRHQDEVAKPGYYKVVFTDDRTVAEATASLRTGMFRFTFPEGVSPQIFVGDAGEISFPNRRTLHAALINTVMNFSEDLLEKKQVKGGYILTFKQVKVKTVIMLKLSTSTIDHIAAQRNLDVEIGTKNFEQLRSHSSAEWQKQLSTVDITDPDQQNKSVFYTALYHSLLIPWVISDSDGRYRGADGKVHASSGKYEYGGFSPWDTFRSLHPLLSLLYPQKQQDAILSMLDVYQQTGHLPTESMTGNHAVPIIVDAWLKGIRGYDRHLAYTAMKKNLMEAPFVQNDMEIYHRKGYVPFSNSESVTRTVEYAYNDWALGQYARLVMHDDTAYKIEQQRGLNYRNLFHPQSLFMLPRKDKDFKLEPGMTGYKEGNKWVYSWFVPHNAKDVINLMGGNAAFAARLDSAMHNNVVLYDNETVLHLPYLFNTAGYPHLTQKWIRDILLNRFKATPGGLPGNDDLGSMSSAYLFNAMGLFPVSPGRPLYAIGAPLFRSVKLHLGGQKIFTIKAERQSRENQYVQSLQFNRQPYEQLVITHAEIMQGGSLDFLMGKSLSRSWPRDRDPTALSETKSAVDIRILNYSVSKNKVEPHEKFWVHFSLTNKGSLGTKKIVLYTNGKPLVYKHVLVPAGTTINDSLSCRLYDPGEVLISLSAGKAQRIQVVESGQAISPAFQLSALKYNPLVEKNAVQKISYVLQNLTGRIQEFRIPLKLNNLLLLVDTVQLSPGKTKLLEHQFIASSAGLQLLTVGTAYQPAIGKADVQISSAAGSSLSVRFKVYSNTISSLLLDLSLVKSAGDTLNENSGFGNIALINGPTEPGAPAGKPVLLGDQSFVEVANSASLDQMGESLSMMCWVLPKEGNSIGLVDMFTKGDHHVLQTNNNKTLTFFAGGWGRGDITVDLPANWMDQWHHLAGVCARDILYLYIDGKLAAQTKVDGVVNLSADSKWQVGRNEEFPSERIFHGYIDQVKVYGQALSSEEISSIADAEKRSLK
jgi:putative alpha-1,2-mannosidase